MFLTICPLFQSVDNSVPRSNKTVPYGRFVRSCNFDRGGVFLRKGHLWGNDMGAMTTMILTATACLAVTGAGEAKGCLKGAAVGGVVGHVAGHHAVAGAAAGCIIEHHREKERDKEAARDQTGPAATSPAPRHPAPTPLTSI